MHPRRLLRVSCTVLGALVVAAALASGCKKSAPVLPGDDVVLAKVNGAPITRFDLEQTLDKTLGKFATARAERRARVKVLDSMIQSRALAALAEAELDPQQKLLVEKEVAAYRESVLVKLYLAKHAPPKPVTPEMKRRYYEEHPERFGALKTKAYELLGSKRALSGQERVQVMNKLEEASATENWQEVATQLSEAGLPVFFAKGTLEEATLHPKLRELMSSLNVGRRSTLTFVQGRAYVARVVGETTVPPRPFAKVQEEIERQLEPVRLREALEAVGAKALERVEVERFEERLTDSAESGAGRGREAQPRVSAAKTDGPSTKADGGNQKQDGAGP